MGIAGYRNATTNDPRGQREELILQCLPQVRYIAKRIHERLPGTVCLDDLISTGIVGLISAIDDYDPSYKVQLNTYAEPRIRGAMLDSLRSLDWAPRDMRKQAKQIEAAIYNAQQKYHREPNEEEIAAELKLSLTEYQSKLQAIQGMDLMRLTNAAGEPGGVMLEWISGSGEDSPAVLLEKAELEKLLAQAIEQMPQIEKHVLNLFYIEEMTLKEIGKILDIHLSRAFQLKTQAILRIRTYIKRRWSL
jgi:RNA polymerase sigma factor for flagellar operon FliA